MKSIDKAIQLKSEVDALRPISKENELRIMQKFRLDWNYHSNHLEGNTLTYGETKALILFGITAQGKPLKDHFEMSGHDEAVKWILDIVKQERPLTENFIRELHKLILKEPYEIDAITPEGLPVKKRVEIGQYKTTPNHVLTKTGEIFRFATPEETPALMQDLIEWYRKAIAETRFNPILIAAEFHYKFIRIHPFDDGNGRTARILMNFILLQNGYPPVIIKTEDKSNYLSVLEQADAGLIAPFVEYIAKNLVRSLEIMIRGAKGESIEEPDDIDKEISLLAQKFKSENQPIDIHKNKETILNIFDNSLVSLFQKFLEKSERFENFYIKNQFNIFVNGSSNTSDKISAFESARNNITTETHSIKLNYFFNGLNKKGFDKFNFTSIIEIKFDFTTYEIINSFTKIRFKKYYTEQLTSDEITEIVNMEVRRHKDFIEKILKDQA